MLVNLAESEISLLKELEIDPNSTDLKAKIQAKIQQFQSQIKTKEKRVVLKLPLQLAPYKFAILPLMKKDGLKEKAEQIYVNLRKNGISCDWDDAGSIGKRYRRQDENGTPFCICVDYQTLEDETVTVRDRDTMEQQRLSVIQLIEFYEQNLIKNSKNEV